MKKYFLIVVIFFLFASCSKKDNDTTTPPPVAHSDTLSAGWSKQQVGTSAGLIDIVFLNNTTGYTLGAGMYKTIDGGVSWSKLTAYIGTYSDNLTLTTDNKVFATEHNTYFARSTDGGASFGKVDVSTIGGMVSDLFFINNTTGYSLTTGGLIGTTDGGSTWNSITPTTGLPTTLLAGSYNTGWFFSTTSGIVANNADIYKSNGNLNSWTKSSFSGATPSGISSLFAVSPSLVYVGISDGKIFQSTDGGATFNLKTILQAGNSGGYLDIHFIDANTGYACYGNRIYKTTDGASSWQTVVALGTSVLSEIHFTDAAHGWGCTDKGEVLKFN